MNTYPTLVDGGGDDEVFRFEALKHIIISGQDKGIEVLVWEGVGHVLKLGDIQKSSVWCLRRGRCVDNWWRISGDSFSSDPFQGGVQLRFLHFGHREEFVGELRNQ